MNFFIFLWFAQTFEMTREPWHIILFTSLSSLYYNIIYGTYSFLLLSFRLFPGQIISLALMVWNWRPKKLSSTSGHWIYSSKLYVKHGSSLFLCFSLFWLKNINRYWKHHTLLSVRVEGINLTLFVYSLTWIGLERNLQCYCKVYRFYQLLTIATTD